MVTEADFQTTKIAGNSLTVTCKCTGQTFNFQATGQVISPELPLCSGPFSKHPPWLLAFLARQVAQWTLQMTASSETNGRTVVEDVGSDAAFPGRNEVRSSTMDPGQGGKGLVASESRLATVPESSPGGDLQEGRSTTQGSDKTLANVL